MEYIMSEDDEFDIPCEDDCFITPCGSLGSKYGVSIGGKFLGEFVEMDDAEKAIREQMEQDQFWPSVWFVSDHGNVSPHSLTDS